MAEFPYQLGSGFWFAEEPAGCVQDSECDDGDVCTDDACDAGACVYTNNTAPCDDSNACTQTDECQAGVCTGTDPVVCTASDQCHDPGTCDRTTGVCDDPAKPDGSTCEDDDFCDGAETCVSGVCQDGQDRCSGQQEACDKDVEECVDCTADSDVDGPDGILDCVDVDRTTSSIEFSDGLFSAPTVVTTGTVVDVPAGVAIEITDAQAPSKGVGATRTGPPSAGDVELFFPCAPLFTVLQKKRNATYTCGSLTIEVIDGTTSVEFVIDGQTHVVVIDVPLGDPPAVVVLEDTTEAGVLMAVAVNVATGSGGAVTVDGEAVAPGSAVTVSAPPRVGDITGPPIDPIEVGAAISVTADFTDQTAGDTHTAEWDWGDGSTSPGTVTESEGSGTVTGDHTYATAGVHTVRLTVTDDNGDEGLSEFRFVVVYDPDGGFVTGGGWIDSPAGAYAADASLTGKANFGFVSKYKKGATVPTGQTQFQFKVADLKFHSSQYEWLVVAGPHAKFKGSGTINGGGNYGFMLTATDGEVNGGGGVDGFRIKIWDKDAGDGIVYDNKMGQSDDSNDTTAIGGGSIVVHDR